MARSNKRPFSGVAFGWEREQSAGRIGFTQAASQAKPSARRKLIVDESEAHVLVVAPTGSGKGVT